MSTTAITTWIAVLGVALGAASLTWHVVSFLLSAGRIKVTAAGNMRMIETGRQTAGESIITITVRNIGRMPVSVETVWLRVSGTDNYLFVPNSGSAGPGPQLPSTVPPGHGATWPLQRDAIVSGLSRNFSGAIKLQPLAVLGSGKSKRGRAIELNLSEAGAEQGG